MYDAKHNLITQVDCDEHKDLAGEYGVSGFPTLKLLKEGKPTDYGGGRTADDIVKYVIKKSGPAAQVSPVKSYHTRWLVCRKRRQCLMPAMFRDVCNLCRVCRVC